MLNLTTFIEPYGIIYVIVNKINKKKYIGQTTQKLNKRSPWFEKSLLIIYRHNLHLINSVNKYGFENFERKILDFTQNQEELNKKEVYYIRKYNTLDPNFGYNIKEGGSNGKHTKETIEKITATSIERWKDPKMRKKVSKSLQKYHMFHKCYNKGKTYEEIMGEERAKERRNKISKTLLGRDVGFGKGYHHSKESKKKLSKSLKKYYRNNEDNRKKYHFSRKFLIQEYWVSEYNMENRILDIKQKSTYQIAKKNDCHSTDIIRSMKKYNIPRRTISESEIVKNMDKEYRRKKETCPYCIREFLVKGIGNHKKHCKKKNQ